MLLLDTPMQPQPIGSTSSFRRSRSLNNLERTISLFDQHQGNTKNDIPTKDNNHEDNTEMTLMEMFSPFGAFEEDEFLGASLTSSSSSHSSFGDNPLGWTRHSQEGKKRSCTPAEVKYDCFGFPLFDLEADNLPTIPQVKLQVPAPVNPPSTTATAAIDAEKAARRARRRRSKYTAKNQDNPAAAAAAPIPAPQPHTPMRRRRSTGLLSASAAKRTDSTSSEPTKLTSKRADGGSGSSSKPRRRKSLSDGGIRAAISESAHDVPPRQPNQRTGSAQLPHSSHQKTSSPRGSRRSLSSGNLRLNEEEQQQPSTKPSTDKKANRRRSGISKRRSVTTMSVSDTGHTKRRSSTKSSMGSSSMPNHASPTSSQRRSTVAVMEDVSHQSHADTGTPDGSGGERKERRRTQRKDLGVANNRLKRSSSRVSLKRQNSGPSLNTTQL